MNGPLIPDFGLTPRDDDEGLFSRNIDGQLVRVDAPTEEDYDKLVTLEVDGHPVQVMVAEPLKDAQGNIVQDINGRTTPRYTTIYDAVTKLGMTASVPTLCHQPHMRPVAVCRLCVVQVYGKRHGRRSPERKLLPACQHQVKDGMEVFTKEAPGPDGERVRRAVTMMTELLMADHLKPAEPPAPAAELDPFNELRQMADRCGLTTSRFRMSALAKGAVSPEPVDAPRGRRGLDTSSPVFLVDHTACILCDRCIRGCDEVKNNFVIGRTGKGRSAGISFDLNDKMFESTCVQCGECMMSCPTSAITFKPYGVVKPKNDPSAEVIALDELKRDPLFAGVPAKFLLWQNGLVLRRRVKAGDILCREGEPGHSAFLIRRGRLQVTPRGAQPITNTVEDVIVGEMACLSGTPRTADVSALDDGEVWEVRRNVLDRMMRSPAQRGLFERLYRERALGTALRASEMLANVPVEERDGTVEFLKPKLEFVRVNPGQTIFEQGDLADNLYLVRLGHVRIGISRYGREATFLYKGPGTVIGEIGLLALSKDDLGRSPGETSGRLRDVLDANASNLSGALPPGERTATCSALDHVELARIGRLEFLQMIQKFPNVRLRLVEMALARMKENV